MKQISPYELTENVFRLIDKDWMLVTAGTKDHFNTMTASWGGMGILWNKPIAIIFIRPTRYTYEFTELSDSFTLCFFDKKHRKALNYCGSHSGREVDKIKETGLITQVTEPGNVYFRQARLIIECRKIYFQDLDPDHFLDPATSSNYPLRDYHRMYFGRIENCWYNEGGL
jgi:flavin reductase (DIM6/NTAB) family NADH-FMN oxidoreductase RutF